MSKVKELKSSKELRKFFNIKKRDFKKMRRVSKKKLLEDVFLPFEHDGTLNIFSLDKKREALVSKEIGENSKARRVLYSLRDKDFLIPF